MPSFTDIQAASRAQHGSGEAIYNDEILAVSPRTLPIPNVDSPIEAMTAQARARRNMSFETAQAMQAAKEGDDSLLLPYQPTPSIEPGRPRTLAAGYDERTKTLRVRFRDGTAWCYYDVPPATWRNFRRVRSPGRFINRVLNNFEYGPDDF